MTRQIMKWQSNILNNNFQVQGQKLHRAAFIGTLVAIHEIYFKRPPLTTHFSPPAERHPNFKKISHARLRKRNQKNCIISKYHYLFAPPNPCEWRAFLLAAWKARVSAPTHILQSLDKIVCMQLVARGGAAQSQFPGDCSRSAARAQRDAVSGI